MKKVLHILVFMLTAAGVTAQTLIPDVNFEQELISQGIDSDGIVNGQVATGDIAILTTLDVAASNISDLTGIEDFAALQVLYCNNNNLTFLNVTTLSNLTELNCSNNPALGSIDVSQNGDLEILRCSNTGLTALDITSNLFLLELYVNFNQLTGLNTSFNAGLGILQCNNNQITGLDLSINDLLTELLCSDNSLEGMIDLTQNPQLISFNATGNGSLYCIQVANVAAANAGMDIYAGWNKDPLAEYSANCLDVVTYVPDDVFEQYLIDQLLDDELDNYVLTTRIVDVTTVDVTSSGVADLTGIEDFAALEELYCANNQLTSLDVSQNTTLFVLDCSANQLTDLTLNTALSDLLCDNNQLTTLDVSQNTNLSALNCSNNQLSGSLLLNGLNMLTIFNAVNNPALTCIQVDDAAAANAGMGQYALWVKDVTAMYSENCAMSFGDFALEESSIIVYPNPASHEIYLVLPSQLRKVVIYTMQGQEALESASEVINVEKLPEGLYFVMIQTVENRRFYKKIVVSGSR
ncbi:MAG: leucine-rich repeat domain-containing protein [Sinomicrobium sp.]|nr:leucine-rich repeat domain-containing protein [Sinomicrobium sp.]